MALLFLSPYGSDTTGDGTIKKPYFTLEKAWDYVAAGDTIFMRGGECVTGCICEPRLTISYK